MDFKRIANTVVDAIIKDLSGRRGLGDEWDQIDEEIKDEIRSTWLATVNRILEVSP